MLQNDTSFIKVFLLLKNRNIELTMNCSHTSVSMSLHIVSLIRFNNWYESCICSNEKIFVP
jgi:hypothetical protein